MTRYARITDDNKCAEFINFEPQGRFHPSIRWLPVPDTLDRWVSHDYIAVDDEIQPPSLDHLRGQLKAELATIRFAEEIAGVTLPDGSKVRTDRESQAQLSSAYQSLTQPFVDSIDWKSGSGWITVTQTELEPIARAVAQHVQRCFSAERRVAERIESSETLDTREAFDAALAEIKTPAE